MELLVAVFYFVLLFNSGITFIFWKRLSNALVVFYDLDAWYVSVWLKCGTIRDESVLSQAIGNLLKFFTLGSPIVIKTGVSVLSVRNFYNSFA